MLYDKPTLVTDSIIANLIEDKPIHMYRLGSSNPTTNITCVAGIAVIAFFLIYKNYAKKQQLKKQYLHEQLQRQLAIESQIKQQKAEMQKFPLIWPLNPWLA